MRARRFPSKSSRTAGPASLLRTICAPNRLSQSALCCFDHGCTGRASGCFDPRLVYRPRVFLHQLRGGPPTAEVASVSINIESGRGHDDEHDDVMYPQVLPFILVHAGCVAAIWSGFSWQAVTICAVLYWLRMFAVTAGYH